MTKELLQQALELAMRCPWSEDRAKLADALRSALAAPMPEPVHQFRQPGCSDWYDGTPDHHDGHGPYEVRTLYAAPPAAPAPATSADYAMGYAEGFNDACKPAPVVREPLTVRELQLIDGMIDVQLHHAKQCDGIANRTMADKQKGWDMERVELLRKLRGIGGGGK